MGENLSPSSPVYPYAVSATAGYPVSFDPAAIETFRFVSRDIDERGFVSLRYALDEIAFLETIELPLEQVPDAGTIERAQELLSLLHWCAGISYFKAAVPETVLCEMGAPPPATASYLEALYSEGLGEFAFTNALPRLPRPRFAIAAPSPPPAGGEGATPQRVLVPIGGGKDSVVALEIMRRTERELALFSVGAPRPIAETGRLAGVRHLVAHRRLDPRLLELNDAGALNGHVPITAVVSCVALLTAALNGFDAVALANERSASSGNFVWDGIEVNHQFSKSLRAERLLRAALVEVTSGLQLFSILRPASELAIARAFARLERYHYGFTSCNAIFRMDPTRRASSWCCDCAKCRFVFLVLAPFMEPEHLRRIFGKNLLDDPAQFEGFALLTATGGHKPFECIGEEQESMAAIAMLAKDPRWNRKPVVQRLVDEILPSDVQVPTGPDPWLTLSGEHEIPAAFLPAVRAVLGA